MKKLAVIVTLGMALAFLPVAQSLLGPQTADAAQAARMKSAEPSIGKKIIDILIVRPFAYIVLASAYITYPIAWLVEPYFGDDRARLKKNWIDKRYDYAINRPLGNFDWESR